MASRGCEGRAGAVPVGVAAGCGVLLVAVYALAVWTVPGQRFEDAVLRAAWPGRASPLVTALDTISIWSLALAAGLVGWIGHRAGGRAIAVATVLMIFATVTTTELLQAVLPRPILLAHGFRREDRSFPSGHTAVATAVLCGLLLAVPVRLRSWTVLPVLLGSAGIGAATVTASWHRPSDTIGSALIVMIGVCLTIAVLRRRGFLVPHTQTAEGGRIVGAVLGVFVTAAVAVAVFAGHRATTALNLTDDPDLAPHGAVVAGRALAIAAAGTATLMTFLLLRGHGPARDARARERAPATSTGRSRTTATSTDRSRTTATSTDRSRTTATSTDRSRKAAANADRSRTAQNRRAQPN
ncbi:phosphatase PAP2 family protein [Actinomadura rupiterrae]|uniref:phosphatase PAP2 family protein n=1 Tax=Actinomadura rupiterrae TaxID=559627 RepID=UPI0020A42318|nr:phosphatase PAP2 family protein [Actinomadura rupiterrae]MCP2338075.1 membrane-associated phospholipid phosphatase [Actinomadura rupiterrae]